MLIKVDLSRFISNSTKYAVIGIDIDKQKTVEDIVNYLVELFNIQYNGNLLLFGGKWFIHGRQPSNILHEFETEYRLEAENETSEVERAEQLTENHSDANGMKDLVSKKFNSSKNDKLQKDLCNDTQEFVKNQIDVNSTSQRKHKSKKRKRSSTKEYVENSKKVKSDVEKYDHSLTGVIPDSDTELDNLHNSSEDKKCINVSSNCIESMDFTDFTIPLKKKRTRKHNKAKKHQKKLASEECSMTKSKNRAEYENENTRCFDTKCKTEIFQVKKRNEIACKKNKYTSLDSNIGKESDHNKFNHLIKHSTPSIEKNYKSIYKTDIPYNNVNDTHIHVSESEIEKVIKKDPDLIRGPPKVFQPFPEPPAGCEAMFNELRMLECSCYPMVFEPKKSSIEDCMLFSNTATTPVPTNDDKPDVMLGTNMSKDVKYHNGINPTKTKSRKLNSQSMINLKSLNTSNKSQKRHPNRTRLPTNSTGGILEMLRQRENGGTSVEEGSLSDSQNSLHGNTNASLVSECCQSIEVSDVVGIGSVQSCIVGGTNSSDNTLDESVGNVNTGSPTVTNNDLKINSLQLSEISSNEIHQASLNSEYITSSASQASGNENLASTDNILEDSSTKRVIKAGIEMELYPIIHTTPVTADIIGFKTVNFDESFQPVFSEYQVGKVMSTAGPILSLNFAEYDDTKKLVIGYTEDTVEVDSREMHDVRLIFP